MIEKLKSEDEKYILLFFGDHQPNLDNTNDYDEKDIRELVGTISTALMNIARENEVRIWIQPFFGITMLDKDSSIVESIDNAMVARNVSERNFETMTY